ncbi:sensor histidine kinase [Streptomyces sp. WAC06614]|uniref:sensor histidine kinase n=1 Tax=Streptomyces sp. WAC06614 TaxID=2487416 RepID=UPI000F76D3E0|nr:histidine kinase [Streptomyces sp. WAC06614]RSS79085.1 histidine kinase [Streptomyces sp. WAC06614]
MQVKPVGSALRAAVAAGRRRAEGWAGSARALDVLTALSCLALMALDLPGLAADDNSLNGPQAAAVLTAGSATLLVRRRAPWLAYVTALVFIGWLHELTLIQFALYSVARYRGRRAGVLATVGYIAFTFVLFNLPGWPLHRADTLSGFLSLVVPIGVLATAVGIAANRQDLVRELDARRAEAAVLHAVQQERTSVARDVHDFVGRELTLLTVRSEVLSTRARRTPYAKDFEELADTARRAHLVLNEIIVQRGERTPSTPGVEGLPALAEESGRAGSPVCLRLDPDVHALSPLRQAAVYRVVQECLTNAAKHARGETIEVSIAADGPSLRISVSNALPARAPGRAPVSAGSGTASMSERVRSLGGSLTATRTAARYEVVATLPRG